MKPKAWKKQLTGSSWNVYSCYASTALSFAGFIYDWATTNPYAENITDSMPGKIEMTLTGDIDLSGYISSLASNGVTPLTLTTNQLKNFSNKTGKGVWSLAEDPVIYVVNDRFMGDSRYVNMTVNSDGTYGCPTADNYHLRLISFFDPTSIKLNINPDEFDDVSNVKVVCNYGVYPDVNKGYTDKYAKMMNLDRPTMKIVKDGESMSIYRSLNSSNKTKYLYLPHTNFMSEQLEETEGNCTVVKQAGSNLRYYGRKMTTAELADIKNFVMSPQVYLPYSTESGTTVYNGEMPDFVVFVTVSFKSHGRDFIFSQRFLPKIQMISANDLSAKYNELVDYSNKCKNKQAVNTLKTNGSVGVQHFEGDGAIQKTLDILKAVTNYK